MATTTFLTVWLVWLAATFAPMRYGQPVTARGWKLIPLVALPVAALITHLTGH